MSLARPGVLLALAMIPLWLWWRARRLRSQPGARMSDTRAAHEASARAWVLRLPPACRAVTLAAWIVAAAGPRLGDTRDEERREGIAIMLAVDLSTSMLAEDFAPENRLDVAKRTAIEFVRARRSDQIGLVAFAAQAITQVPLTTDHAVLEGALRQLRIGLLEDGTAIGTGLGTAANRLRRAPGASRVVVLLTDGVNNAGTVDPRTAADAAAALGMRVYTIGVGTLGEAPVPMGQGPQGLRYETMPVQIDEDVLRDVAQVTGGRYFRATDAQSLENVFREIDRLERTPIQHTVYRRLDETYRLPVAVGLLALALEIVLAATLAVRIP